jgi:hypothetical protein
MVLGDSNAVGTLYVSATGLFGVTDTVLHSLNWWEKSKVLLQEQQLN